MRLCREPRERVASHVDAWLFKTCRNIAMDVHRKEGRMANETYEVAISITDSGEQMPGDKMIDQEERQQLARCIAELPSIEREAVLLRLGQGLSYKQISDVMELSVSHVGVLLHQALTRLRGALNPGNAVTGGGD